MPRGRVAIFSAAVQHMSPTIRFLSSSRFDALGDDLHSLRFSSHHVAARHDHIMTSTPLVFAAIDHLIAAPTAPPARVRSSVRNDRSPRHGN
jgi:hypothetical protein